MTGQYEVETHRKLGPQLCPGSAPPADVNPLLVAGQIEPDGGKHDGVTQREMDIETRPLIRAAGDQKEELPESREGHPALDEKPQGEQDTIRHEPSYV